MAIYFGNNKIKNIYVGSIKIKEVYYGSEKVWGEIDPSQGYWVHRSTGVKTYFDADADFITDGIVIRPSWGPDCSEVKIPSGVIGLGAHCFLNCSAITSINIPEGVVSLGQACFAGCLSLVSINIPEGVVSLGQSCFEVCQSLTSITIPESVTSIGEYCFSGCKSLTLATVLPAIPPSLGPDAFDGVHSSFNIKVNSPYVNDYKTAPGWSEYASIISGIQIIDSYLIDTNDNIYYFDSSNTPIKNFCTTGNPVIIGGQSIDKNTIKEIHFGNSYNSVTSIGG